jgi:hypothetical protein
MVQYKIILKVCYGNSMHPLTYEIDSTTYGSQRDAIDIGVKECNNILLARNPHKYMWKRYYIQKDNGDYEQLLLGDRGCNCIII